MTGMGKADRTELALDRLGALKSETDDALQARELKSFLGDRSNLVIAKAAKIARELGLVQLVPELVQAFAKLMADAPRLDKRCAEVTEIVKALYEMDYCEPEVYRRGLAHVQMEASFGPPIDVAADLRGICAQGLLRTRDPEAIEKVVGLLVDSQASARAGAVRALATNGGETGALLIRLKALTGDKDVEVMAECFTGLLAVQRDKALGFVADYADSSGEVAEAAILALGTSRIPQAIEWLKQKWERIAGGGLRKVFVLSLAASRNEDALSFLVSQLERGSLKIASEIIAGLATHKHSERVRQAVSKAVEARGEKTLLDTFRREFPET
jgi:hypothetical protein